MSSLPSTVPTVCNCRATGSPNLTGRLPQAVTRGRGRGLKLRRCGAAALRRRWTPRSPGTRTPGAWRCGWLVTMVGDLAITESLRWHFEAGWTIRIVVRDSRARLMQTLNDSATFGFTIRTYSNLPDESARLWLQFAISAISAIFGCWFVCWGSSWLWTGLGFTSRTVSA